MFLKVLEKEVNIDSSDVMEECIYHDEHAGLREEEVL